MTFACKIEQNTPVFSCPFLWYKFYSGLKVDPLREGVMFGFHVGCQKKKIAKANVFKYTVYACWMRIEEYITYVHFLTTSSCQ